MEPKTAQQRLEKYIARKVASGQLVDPEDLRLLDRTRVRTEKAGGEVRLVGDYQNSEGFESRVGGGCLGWANEYYLIRTSSIVHHIGVFKVLEEEYSLRNIEALTMEQGFWQRVFNYGTIHFFSPVLKQEYYLNNINRPKEVRDLIDGIVHSNKSGKSEKIIFRR